MVKISMEQRKIGRNDPCPCGSGKKYKKCCIASVMKERSTFVDLTPYDLDGRPIINNKCANCGEIIDITGYYIPGKCPRCGRPFNPNPFPFLDDE